MPAKIGKEDLRIIKTEKALHVALCALLENQNFNKITVSDICEKALISRATFYTHFTDKYDLLKYWLFNLKPDNINDIDTYEQIEKTVNQLIYDNEIIIKNLIDGADNETMEIIFNFILSTLDLSAEEKAGGKFSAQYIVLSNFYAGGIMYYLIWQVKHKFPADILPMNIYLYEVMEKFQELRTQLS